MPFNNKMLALMGRKGGGASSWNDLKDKPFYDSRVTGEVKITFDGSIEGKEYLYFEENSTYWVKVSNHVPTTEEFMGGKVVSAWGQPGAIEYWPYEELWEPDDFGGIYNFDGMIIFVPQDVPTDSFTWTAGTWFQLIVEGNGTLSYISELSYTGTTGELKKLDAKYLPEDLVLDYSTDTPEIISGSVNAVLQKLATHQKACVTILKAFEDPDMIYRQYTVTGLSGYTYEDGGGRLYIHFMYFEYNGKMSEERIFVFSADGQHEETITSSGAPM